MNVGKRYGEFTAVDNISFDVQSGRIFGFLGPNGAGKTSTIRMIVGITQPDVGQIEMFGEPFRREMQNRIGYLPEERGLYKKMPIAEQLRYFANLKGMATADADKRIDFWLERVGLSQWKNKKSSDLSKGMQQKIQFITAVLHEPDLLIFDEPFSGLDPVNVELMIEVVLELKARGKTIIFSTHLMETAERLCDDIILINRSKKVLGGTLREVKESFRQNLVALRATGDGAQSVLADTNLVAKVTAHSDSAEVILQENADPQMLLQMLLQNGVNITRFEIIEPSLNEIFINAVNAGTARNI